MKKRVAAVLILALAVLTAGCTSKSAQEQEYVTIGNPWSEWTSLKEAEHAAGFPLHLPETIADSYTALHYRTMDGDMKLLEVVYSDSEDEVTIRKAKGEDQDISGVYGYDQCETQEWNNGEPVTFCTTTETADKVHPVRILLSHDGYSWSIYAPNGFEGNSYQGFLNAIFA